MFRLGKKTIALVMAATVAISGFVFPSAKTAKAADPEPTVKVLGATLRTDGNNQGTQSLRVGIEVANASYASECGIKVKLKDSSNDYKVVSTKNENYQKLYSKDTTNDTVVYTVVVSNIPIDTSVDTELIFQGFVRKISDGKTIESTVSEGKSLNNVLQAIGEEYNQTLRFASDGTILALVNSLKTDGTEEFKNKAGSFIVGRDNEFKDYCKYDAEEGCYVIDYTDESLNETFSNGGFKGIGYRQNNTGGEYIYSVSIKSDTETFIRLIPHWNGYTGDCSGAGTIVSGPEWQTCDMKIKNATEASYCFGTGNANTYWSGEVSCAGKYYIRSLDIYKVWGSEDIPDIVAPPTGWNADHTEYSIKLDENSVKPNDKCSVVKNDNGSYTFTSSDGSNYEIGFSFPEEIWSNYDFRQMKITYKNASGFNAQGRVNKYGQSSPWWNDGEDANYGGSSLADGAGSAIFSVKEEKIVDGKYFSAFRFFNIPADATVTIKSIILTGLEKHEAAEPTATPIPTATPAPAPKIYSIENEALKNSYKGENGGPSSAEYDNANNVMNFSFTGYTGVIYTIPDNTIDTSVYKYAQVTYTSSGGSLDAYACQSDDTYPDSATTSLTASDTEKIVTISGFGKGAIKLFHWGYNSDTNIAIKSIKFYQNNPETVSEDENGIIMNLPSNYNASQSGKNYGTFVNDKYYSTYTKTERPFNVILPYGYSENKKYPVIYMLHGIFCNQDSFGSSAETCSIVKTSGNLYSDGDAKEAIIVIPSIRVCADSSIEDSFSADNYKLYDLFREDLIDCLMPYMEANYSIATGRENTAIAGFSMGGRESLYIGISKPEYFGYIGAFCPTYGIFKYEPNWTGVGEDGLFADTASFTLPAQYMNNTYAMIVKGTKDTTVHEMPTTYHNALTSNGVPHVYYEVEGGGHDEATWGHGMYNFLRKVFK